MSVKLDKLGADRARALRKRDEWDTKYKELDRLYKERENTEIHDIVHAAKHHQYDGDKAADRLTQKGVKAVSGAEIYGRGQSGDYHQHAQKRQRINPFYNGIFFSYATINPSIKNFVRSIQKNEINKHATTNEWLSVKYCKFPL